MAAQTLAHADRATLFASADGGRTACYAKQRNGRTASHLAAADHAQVAARCAPVSAAIRCWGSVTSGERAIRHNLASRVRQNRAWIDYPSPWGYRSSSGC